jgi:DNA-binding transcriptional LysR family regulator
MAAAMLICKNAVPMDWNDLRHLLTVARAGTLAGAARRLGVNQTTVARRLAAAEAALGARLFERRNGLLSPTKAGEAALARAAQIELEVEALERAVGGADTAIAGTVRLTAVPILANRILIPALPEFHAEQPLIHLELIAEPRNLSLTRREADIALRLARPEAGAALARRIGYLDYAVYGARGKAARQLPWITYEEGWAHLPQARFLAKAMQDGASAPLSVSDAESLLQAVRAGIGKSLLPCLVADRDPRLCKLTGAAPVLAREIWLLTHRELRRHARIGAVIAWLDKTLTRVHPRGAA